MNKTTTNRDDRQVTDVFDFTHCTPVPDELVKLYGPICAVVFGRIWRCCQTGDQVCRVPLSHIAKELKLERSTVSRYAARLVEEGYLEDLTPDAGKRPHSYKDTGKVKIGIPEWMKAGSNSQSVVLSNREEQKNVGVAQKNTDEQIETGAQHSSASTSRSEIKQRWGRKNATDK